MYSDFLLIDNDAADPIRVERLAFGETGGRNEAWLRDTLLKYPELLPIRDLDPSFGPLIPICRELRTTAGPIDAVFINGHGRLTLVECKLWRSPEARRKVVAQILDYARVVSRWSYSEFQGQVSSATGRKGNVPFEIAREEVPGLSEQTFVDQVAACMRQGRFLLVIAGDGIREDVPELANLVNRHAALGFSFGLVEIALFGMAGGELLVQPRVVAKTQLIERAIVIVRGTTVEVIDPDDAEAMEPSTGDQGETNELGESPQQAAYRRWWQPVMDTPLDDPAQQPPRLFWPNNIRAALPWDGTWILCYRFGGEDGKIGVCTAGRKGADQELLKMLEPQRAEILASLPTGSEYRPFQRSPGMTYDCRRRSADFPDDDKRREWLAQTLNGFVNVFRPRIKELLAAK